jgi:hypothetical protein
MSNPIFSRLVLFCAGRAAFAVDDWVIAVPALLRSAVECPDLKLHALDAVRSFSYLPLSACIHLFSPLYSLSIFLFCYQLAGIWRPKLEADHYSSILHQWASFTFEQLNQVHAASLFACEDAFHPVLTVRHLFYLPSRHFSSPMPL